MTQVRRVFEFLRQAPEKYPDNMIERMVRRHRLVIEPYLREIEGADVLDLASHDGRWCYAFAEAGARTVTGVEGRPENVAQFARFPASEHTRKICLVCGDMLEFLESQVAAG